MAVISSITGDEEICITPYLPGNLPCVRPSRMVRTIAPKNNIGSSRMNSFQRGDWLSLAQTIATFGAIAAAFGVVFVQNRLEKQRAEAVARKNRIRERYRASTYAEALIGNAIHAASETVAGVDEWAKKRELVGDWCLETDRLDQCADALAQALHQALPTEITKSVLAAWTASQLLARAAHRTAHSQTMRIRDLLEHCREQLAELEKAQQTVQQSRAKWQRAFEEQ